MDDSPKGRRLILVVDDSQEMGRLLSDQLADAGYDVKVTQSGDEALAFAQKTLPDLAITDLRMERVDGLDVLDGLHQIDPGMPVLIMTAFGAIETAIEAMRRGAYHYLTKPFQLGEMLVFIERALGERQIRDENRALRRLLQDRGSGTVLVGKSSVMQHLNELVDRVAKTHAPVLIRGESGTGKELVARALHERGVRRDRPFVAVNCTALPEALLESELFGHAKGAFTGATVARRGLFLEADGGTLFLDEIGDMVPGLQAKLLRALESGEVRAVGADGPRKVDVRIIAATHQDLERRVTQGLFRADLYYRLNVVPIDVPPLRLRIEDIPELVERFILSARAKDPGCRARRFSEEVLAWLAGHSFPGNVRELENLVTRLCIIAQKEEVTPLDLRMFQSPEAAATEPAPLSSARRRLPPLRQLENEYIAYVVEQCGGNKTRAAEILKIDVSTIHRRDR